MSANPDSKYSTDVLRRVFDNTEGACIEVGPDNDGLGVTICTPDSRSVAYFGVLRITVAPEFARQLGEALIAAAKEAA